MILASLGFICVIITILLGYEIFKHNLFIEPLALDEFGGLKFINNFTLITTTFFLLVLSSFQLLFKLFHMKYKLLLILFFFISCWFFYINVLFTVSIIKVFTPFLVNS